MLCHVCRHEHGVMMCSFLILGDVEMMIVAVYVGGVEEE